jgi:hypothetical protein
VFAILLCAPIGVFLIHFFAPRLLEKGVPPPPRGSALARLSGSSANERSARMKVSAGCGVCGAGAAAAAATVAPAASLGDEPFGAAAVVKGRLPPASAPGMRSLQQLLRTSPPAAATADLRPIPLAFRPVAGAGAGRHPLSTYEPSPAPSAVAATEVVFYLLPPALEPAGFGPGGSAPTATAASPSEAHGAGPSSVPSAACIDSFSPSVPRVLMLDDPSPLPVAVTPQAAAGEEDEGGGDDRVAAAEQALLEECDPQLGAQLADLEALLGLLLLAPAAGAGEEGGEGGTAAAASPLLAQQLALALAQHRRALLERLAPPAVAPADPESARRFFQMTEGGEADAGAGAGGEADAGAGGPGEVELQQVSVEVQQRPSLA